MQYHTLLALAAALSLVFLPTSAAATECQAESGNATVALLELYTSEGCSSCPPAEQWIATLGSKGLTHDRVVPLALHVDYWNDLGWEDPYAQQSFTQRQYRYARIYNSHAVYTPQIILNGRDLPRWRRTAIETIQRINKNPARAKVTLALARNQHGVTVKSNVTAKKYSGRTDLYVAVYENNIVRSINAGENIGRTLHHQYVVHELYGPVRADKNGTIHFSKQVNPDKTWSVKDLGFVAFVQDRDSGEILQTLSLPMCF